MVPVIGVDHAPTTAFAMKAYTPPPGLPTSLPMSNQLASASGQGLETQSTVSNYAMLMIVVANY